MQKLATFFSHNKDASTEPHNYPINQFFSVNKNLVHIWCVSFFLDVNHNILQNMRFWKEDQKNAKTFFCEQYQKFFKMQQKINKSEKRLLR